MQNWRLELFAFCSIDLKSSQGCHPCGCRGVPWHPQILADQLTLSQPGEGRLCPPNDTGNPGFSDFPTPLLKMRGFQYRHLAPLFCTSMIQICLLFDLELCVGIKLIYIFLKQLKLKDSVVVIIKKGKTEND